MSYKDKIEEFRETLKNVKKRIVELKPEVLTEVYVKIDDIIKLMKKPK